MKTLPAARPTARTPQPAHHFLGRDGRVYLENMGLQDVPRAFQALKIVSFLTYAFGFAGAFAVFDSSLSGWWWVPAVIGHAGLISLVVTSLRVPGRLHMLNAEISAAVHGPMIVAWSRSVGVPIAEGQVVQLYRNRSLVLPAGVIRLRSPYSAHHTFDVVGRRALMKDVRV
jgi:hypothetical protein